MMDWTQKRPTESGFYWTYDEHRTEGDAYLIEVRMVKQHDGSDKRFTFRTGIGRVFLDHEVGGGNYYFGPLTPPP
jgi:hypothetical protein